MPHTTLISASDLARELDASWVLLDCRFALGDTEEGRLGYQQGHLPGAHYAHLDEDLSGHIEPGITGRHPLPEPDAFRRLLGAWGIQPGTQVVAYDQGPGAFAARAWWLLRYFGHDSVAVLNGGVAAWLAAGLELISDVPERRQGIYPIARAAAHTASAEDLLSGLSASVPAAAVLVDARAPERYQGLIEPLDPVAGHIPGAKNRPFQANLLENGTFRQPDELRAVFEMFGPAENQVHYCGSGVTAAHNILAMEVAGLSGARLYPGSWSEWVTEPDRPVETSLPR